MAKDHITLSECTKADLRWIIDRILQMTTLNNGDWYLQRALSDLWYEKEERRLEEGEKQIEVYGRKLREYSQLLEPYDGKPLREIPETVVKKATQLLIEAEEADKKWRQYLGLNE